jgi:hypothetical protein
MHTGIDIGLGVTSIRTVDDKGNVVSSARFGTKINKKTLALLKENKPLLRYSSHAKCLFEYCSQYALGTVIMEEPMHTRPGAGARLFTLRGYYLSVLDRFITDNKLKNPKASQIKKYWTGKGNATKAEMRQEAEDRGYGELDEHDADSTAMANMSINYDWEEDS